MSPPKATAALWQFIGPSYAKFIFAELRPARQPTKATSSVFGVRDTPRMPATACAVALPPATHPVASAFPAAMASARPRQPAKPQAPQLEPGRAPSTCSIFGSRWTWKARLEKPSSDGEGDAEEPEGQDGDDDQDDAHRPNNPLNPRKASDIRLAVMKAIGYPWKLRDTGARLIRSRMAAKSTIDTP